MRAKKRQQIFEANQRGAINMFMHGSDISDKKAWTEHQRSTFQGMMLAAGYSHIYRLYKNETYEFVVPHDLKPAKKGEMGQQMVFNGKIGEWKRFAS